MTPSTFTRRAFMRRVGALGVTAALLPKAKSHAAEKLDRYGGLTSIKFAPNGFFRVEKGDRWWFVTPDGGAFLSFGLNHPNPDYITQSYNVDYWKKQFGVDDETSPEFREAFVQKTWDDMELFGMNTLGCHAFKPQFGTITVPYIQGLFLVRSAYWLVQSPRDFPDVFSPGFVQRCETIAERVVAERKDDPYLMGYTFTNVPILTDADADAHGQVAWGRSQPDMPTWPRVLRNHGANSPGKRVFVDLARERYADIAAFNRVYGTSMESFDELARTADWSPTVKAAAIADADDNRAFLLKILERYYTVGCAAVRKFDTNHMIFGDPLNANSGVPDDVMSVIARHIDLVPYQWLELVRLDGHVGRLEGRPAALRLAGPLWALPPPDAGYDVPLRGKSLCLRARGRR